MSYIDPAELAADPHFRQFVAGFAADLAGQMRPPAPPPPPPKRPTERVGDAGDPLRVADLAVMLSKMQPPAPTPPSFPWTAMIGLGLVAGLALGLAIAAISRR